MSLVSFPAGVAPIPGEPGQIQAAARTYSSVADNLRGAADGVLTSAQGTEGSWSGMSAEAFRAATYMMEQRVAEAASTFSEIAGVLQTYASRLAEAKRRYDDAMSTIAGLRNDAAGLERSMASLPEIEGPLRKLVQQEIHSAAGYVQGQISAAQARAQEAYDEAERAAQQAATEFQGLQASAPSMRLMTALRAARTLGAGTADDPAWEPLSSLRYGDQDLWYMLVFGSTCLGGHMGVGSWIRGPDGREWPLIVPGLMIDGEVYSANKGATPPWEDVTSLGGKDPGWRTVYMVQGTTRVADPPSGLEKFFIGMAGMNPNLHPEVRPADSEALSALAFSGGVPFLRAGTPPSRTVSGPPVAPEFHIESPTLVMRDGELVVADRNNPASWNREIRRQGITPNTRLQNLNRSMSAVDLGSQVLDGISLAQMADDAGVVAYQGEFQVNEDGRRRAMLRTYSLGVDDEGYVISPNHVYVDPESGDFAMDNMRIRRGAEISAVPDEDDVKWRIVQYSDEELDD